MDNNSIVYYIARFLIGFLFVYAAIANTLNFQNLIAVLREKKFPFVKLFFACGIVFEFIAGSMLILGLYINIMANCLILFTIIAVFLFHDFWHKRQVERELNKIIFITHLTATIGALLLLTRYNL